jgi:hypothetical protein
VNDINGPRRRQRRRAEKAKKKGKREAKTRHAQQMEKNHQFSVKTFSRAEVFLGQEEDVKVLLIIDSEGCPPSPSSSSAEIRLTQPELMNSTSLTEWSSVSGPLMQREREMRIAMDSITKQQGNPRATRASRLSLIIPIHSPKDYPREKY